MEDNVETQVSNNQLIKKKPKQWHGQQEQILKKWSEIGSSYRFMHDRAYIKFQSRNLKFALPVIVISTITGTANFAQSSFPEEWETYVPLVIGFFNLLAGLITTIAQFLRVSELLEGHRSATIAYSKLSRNISVELSLPREERNSDGAEFVNNCRTELDRLIEQSPNIPMDILKNFGKRFNASNINKPDILDITPVDIFIDKEKDTMDKKLKDIKNQELIKRELLNTENLRRKQLLKELQLKERIKNEQQQTLIKNEKIKKKQAIKPSDITGKLDKFIQKLNVIDNEDDMLTPTTSERTTSERTTSDGSISNQVNLEKENNIKSNIENEPVDIIITTDHNTIIDQEYDIDIIDISNNNVKL